MSSFISLNEAVKMTKTYREQRRNIVDSTKNDEVLPICETFDRAHIETLLAKDNCVAIRAYFGVDENENVKLLLVAVNENEEDIYSGTDTLLDKAARCPSVCPPSSPLNT